MKRVLIIGATSSIASNVARLYAARGDKLYLLARNESKLAALKAELNTQLVGDECLDFSEYQENAAAIQRACSQLGGIDIVLIAHGYLGNQLLSETSFDEALQSTTVNYLSVASQLIELTRHMEATGKGSIAVISSVAAERGRPRNYTYGASKAALTTYLQGLRSRLWPQISVTTIKLGPVDTPMTKDHIKNASFTTSERAAQAIVRAIDRKKQEVYVPGYWRVVMLMVRNMPERIFQRLAFLSAR